MKTLKSTHENLKHNSAGATAQNERDKAGYEQAAEMRRAGIAQNKREAGYRTVKVEGISTSGDSMSRPGPVPKVKSYDPL